MGDYLETKALVMTRFSTEKNRTETWTSWSERNGCFQPSVGSLGVDAWQPLGKKKLQPEQWQQLQETFGFLAGQPTRLPQPTPLKQSGSINCRPY